MLKKQAKENKISVSELCRQKIRNISQLTKIEIKLDNLIKKIGKDSIEEDSN
jgi:hypothetical protein